MATQRSVTARTAKLNGLLAVAPAKAGPKHIQLVRFELETLNGKQKTAAQDWLRSARDAAKDRVKQDEELLVKAHEERKEAADRRMIEEDLVDRANAAAVRARARRIKSAPADESEEDTAVAAELAAARASEESRKRRLIALGQYDELPVQRSRTGKVEDTSSAVEVPKTLKAALRQTQKGAKVMAAMRTRITNRVENLNKLVTEQCADIEKLVDEYNGLSEKAAEQLDNVLDLAQEDYDSHGEAWRDGDRGESFDEWMQSIRAFDPQPLALSEPTEIELEDDEGLSEALDEIVEDSPIDLSKKAAASPAVVAIVSKINAVPAPVPAPVPVVTVSANAPAPVVSTAMSARERLLAKYAR